MPLPLEQENDQADQDDDGGQAPVEDPGGSLAEGSQQCQKGRYRSEFIFFQ